MREIRTSGSEGGGVEPNRPSLPLSVLQVFEQLPWAPAFAGASAPREGALLARCKSVPGSVAGPVIEGNCVAVRRGGEQPEVNRQSVG
jgi:hypothetical protein